ncbi:MAG TPA: TPM domain-containing protein [Steroidobacteraceae bacterium]|nr:TPM domain-containing protein [Steroidobacteraceae bacterium]
MRGSVPRRLLRLARHVCSTRAGTHRLFSPALLQQIEQACSAAEARHAGEIRFAVETSLPLAALWHGITPRERALALFAQLHIWDTEHNNGVLIYVLRADRAVEIIADRGINARVSPSEWQSVCREVETQYRAGRVAEGSKAAIAGVAALLEQHFPALRSAPANELPNQPILL